MKNLIRRKLQIVQEDCVRDVVQLNYLSWPDHGAPEARDYQIIEKLLEYIQEYHKKPVSQLSPQSQG